MYKIPFAEMEKRNWFVYGGYMNKEQITIKVRIYEDNKTNKLPKSVRYYYGDKVTQLIKHEGCKNNEFIATRTFGKCSRLYGKRLCIKATVFRNVVNLETMFVDKVSRKYKVVINGTTQFLRMCDIQRLSPKLAIKIGQRYKLWGFKRGSAIETATQQAIRCFNKIPDPGVGNPIEATNL